MFKIKENDLFSKNMSGSELYKTTKLSKDNSKKLVTDYDKVSFDKWMKDLIDQNGVTKYQYDKEIRKQVGRSNSTRSNNNSNNDSKMMKYPKIIGWSVVTIMWSTLLITGEYHARKTNDHNRAIQETINTAEDMCGWIVEDVANGYVDSTYADMYIDNLEGIIIDLGVTR